MCVCVCVYTLVGTRERERESILGSQQICGERDEER